MSNYKLLPEDKVWIEVRLEYLQGKIKDLGPEFHEVLNQSSETWHDNAPFDAVRDKQSLLYAEYSHLKYILLGSERVTVTNHAAVGIGHRVSVEMNSTHTTYFIAGDWTHNVGELDESGAIIISCQAPVALALLGKRIHDETKFGTIVTIA